MKAILLLHIGLFLCSREYSNAQPLTIEWSKCLGGSMADDGFGIKQTSDGFFFACGEVASNDGDVYGNHSNQYDGWVAKLDSNGNIVWQRCYGGSDGENFKSIVLNDNGGFTAAGFASSTDGDVIGAHGNGDYWVVNCNDTGAIQWQKILGGSSDEAVYQIISTYNHGYMVIGPSGSSDFDVVGNHDSLSLQAWDTWLVKLDSVGDIDWARCYGGCWMELGYTIAQTPDSGFVFASSARSDNGDVQGLHGATNGQGFEDYWVVKINATGAIQWQKCLGGSTADIPYDIKVTQDGGCIVTGVATSNDFDVTGHHNVADVWIVKLDIAGNTQWQKCLGGSGADYGWKILPMADGGYLTLNSTESTDGDLASNPPQIVDAWLVKLDSLGNIIWQQCLGGLGLEELHDMDLTSDGGCVLTGITSSNDGYINGNHGNFDDWVIKLGALPDEVVTVRNSITDFTAYFNNSGNLTVNFFANGNEHTQVQLIDITGRKLLQQRLAVTEGFNKKEVRTGEMAAGVYIVRLVTEGGSVSKKLAVGSMQ